MANNKSSVQQGFSPKPASVSVETEGSNSSEKPETHSPEGEMDGPIVQSAQAQTSAGGSTTQDQVVRFKK